MIRLAHLASFVSACIILTGIALAGPVGDFEASLRSAYADYRSALFQTNANNPEQAAKAAVIDKFGPARPFTNIINAEQRHSDAILTLMDAYGVSPPENTYLDDPEVVASVPDSIAEACRMGVQAELANRDLYDVELIPKATDYPDIVAVLQNLRDASQNRHLPAFQRCS